MRAFLYAATLFTTSIAFQLPSYPADTPKSSWFTPSLSKKSPSPCLGNTPSTRHQWCEHDIYTDYTSTVPEGETREFWLDLSQQNLAPDGRPRWTLAINGSIPGPTLEVNWGDTVVVHLRNSLPDSIENGTSMHFHGIRQYYSNLMDGVVAITQCPLAPNHTITYRWRATQYGTTWYHSHIGLQTWEGVFGGIIIHGPASANYDEDKGVILLNDWDLHSVDELWDTAQLVGPPTMDNALINGMNVFGPDGAGQIGRRFNLSFEAGKSYRLRMGNAACDTHFKFSIDHHTLTVIANDLVPIRPYQTTVLDIAIGQRYDIITHANQAETADAFWLRAIPQTSCSKNSNARNIRGIVYYTHVETIPDTVAHHASNTCDDEDAAQLIPLVSHDLHLSPDDTFYTETFPATVARNENAFLRWQLNGTSMHLNWSAPTLRQIQRTVAPPSRFPASHAVISIPRRDTWVAVVVETSLAAPHPVHLHGHDFLVVAQGEGSYTPPPHGIHAAAGTLPKRDTAVLPAQGYLVLAFRTDNPGAWLLHCHIGWHLEQGFALQFVEREVEIRELLRGEWTGDTRAMGANCERWDRYWEQCVMLEDGSGV
ncbi:hypothetical protein N7512_007073 [Penicillium capsulatum]|nr:hypothetical protein N7512_007073 [Penicillium capsulatum]